MDQSQGVKGAIRPVADCRIVTANVALGSAEQPPLLDISHGANGRGPDICQAWDTTHPIDHGSIKMLRLLSLSGSLRTASSNTHTLIAAGLLVPPGVVVEHYDEIGELPHFNPDLEVNLPQSIVDLRTRVGQADGLLISCPEYARGIPGSFKNMLDWLVGSLDFPGKPVALFNTSPRASAAQAALKLVLETMSATLVHDACVTLQLLGKQTDPVAIANDPVSGETLRQALQAIVEHLHVVAAPS